jgi:hypothetical protein
MKVQIIQWWLRHKAKEDGKKKTKRPSSRLDVKNGYVKDDIN